MRRASQNHSRKRMMMSVQARLVVVGGDVKTSEIKLRLPCTIGRGRGSTIVLAHPLVSRQHCEIFEAEGRLMVRDLGSLNGTFVNNQRIGETAPLPPNELLTVGTVTFRAVYEESAGPAPADESPLTDRGVDTVYAGRAASSGTGTVPVSLKTDQADSQPGTEKGPASQSSLGAFPPLGPLPPSGPQNLLPPAPDMPESMDSAEEESAEEESDKKAADDDLADFLKSLSKDPGPQPKGQG